ncbi:MAG: hypothetical protein BGP09_25330 [Rhizobium sp. 60-20]|jgi:hypothetical protein|nr:MAG: hypothetical protein BGP09_25330 [Rhizobium sp. 60-20]RKD36087.1 hypothetical protein BJ928_12565 [Rhizobium sp. WW_1]
MRLINAVAVQVQADVEEVAIVFKRTIFWMMAALALVGCVNEAAPGTSVAAAKGGGSGSGWAGVLEVDRRMAANGGASPELVRIDTELAKLQPEGEKILATRDKARAEVWSKKYNALMAERSAAIRKFSAKSIAQSNAITNALGGASRPNPCLNAMGGNTCVAPDSGGDSQTLPGYNSWCQDPADATRLVPCNL